MEEFSQLGGCGGGNSSRGSFFYHLPSSAATGITTSSAAYGQGYIANTTSLASNLHPPSSFKSEVASSSQMGAGDQLRHHGLGHHGEISHGGHVFDDIKAKIMSHPHYSSLLGAFMECQKVGAPQEVVARLSAMTRELESRSGCSRHKLHSDPELDQFMEAYSDMLLKYREELTRPLQEATDYLKSLESQLTALTNASSSRLLIPSDANEKSEAVGSSEEDQDGSGGEAELPEFDPHAEDKELKHQLLKKYSGYLSSLRQELSKKKKKGKLPKEARQKLLNWWELHYKWPYPSETEKLALAESTGLDQKQINNWFINQRKRHWKPSEDMQFVVMDGFHPQHASSFFADGQFLGDGMYRLGP